MVTLARQLGPDLGAYETAFRDHICQTCPASPTAGDYCYENLARSCPLSRCAGEVVDLVQHLDRSSAAESGCPVPNTVPKENKQVGPILR
jgi:hypothetical protein